MSLDVIDEDGDVLVVNKPADLVCHPTKDGEHSSLIGRVRLYLGTADGRLVNRLDRETSGVVLLAKTREASRELGLALASRQAEKRYTAIVHGHVARATLSIDAPLGRDETSAVAIKDCVREDGAPAETHVRLVGTFERDGRPFSILDVAPVTGRKHQIRIHLAHAGHPIVGDKLYGGDEGRYLRLVGRALTDEDRRALMLPHHALHARQLTIAWRGRVRDWRAPLPAALAAFAYL